MKANFFLRTSRFFVPFVLLLFFGSPLEAQEKKTYTIGILGDAMNEHSRELMNQMIRETQAVVGEDAIIKFSEDYVLINEFSLDRATQNYNRMLDMPVDLILVFGTVNAMVMGQQQQGFPKPVILYGSVNKDLIPLRFDQTTSGVGNLTYLIASQSYKEDLTTFKELVDFKTIGIAIERPVAESLRIQGFLNDLIPQFDSQYKLIAYDNAADIVDGLEGIDALYLAGGFFLSDSEMAALAQECISKNIPSFTATEVDDVAAGLMATNTPPESTEQILRRIALSIEGYVNGTPLADMNVFIDYEKRLTLNYNTAEKVGVDLKYSTMVKTDFIGELVNPKAVKTYNLLDVMTQALETNLGLRAAQKDVELSVQDTRTAKSNYLPSITANAQGKNVDKDIALITNPEWSTAGSISLDQTLFSAAANANINVQKQLLLAQEQNYQAEALDMIFEGAQAYFNVLVNKVNVKIQSQNLELTKKNLRVAEQNFEAGQSGKPDMLRFKSQMAQNTQTLVEAINQLDLSYLQLNQLLNNPLDHEIEVADAVFGQGVFERYNYNELTELLDNPSLREPFGEFLSLEALKNAPELRSMAYNLEATERNIKLFGLGRFLPTLGLQGGYNKNFNQWGKGATDLNLGGYNVALAVSIPLVDRNRQNINKKTAMIQKEQLLLNKEGLEQRVRTNIRTGMLSVINEYSNIKLSDISEEAAREGYELTEVSYSEGAVNIVQLLDAQNNYLNAQLANASAKYQFLLNSIQLERFIGYNFLLHSDAENLEFMNRFEDYLNNPTN
ncbi:TolC family protein [Sediminicola luteus]|nr:TolC family protein [Sediminicola luteus]